MERVVGMLSDNSYGECIEDQTLNQALYPQLPSSPLPVLLPASQPQIPGDITRDIAGEDVGTAVSPISQVRKLTLKEVK